MKFKLDGEYRRAGRSTPQGRRARCSTVYDQSLGGALDNHLFNVCIAEKRTLITLDHDFGQVIRFPPETSYAIVILELPPRANPTTLTTRLQEFLSVLAIQPLGRELWIVEPGSSENLSTTRDAR